MKYIIFESDGLEQPIIFSELIDHESIKDCMPSSWTPIGAGFCNITDEGCFQCYGGSFTLNLVSKAGDSVVLNLMADFRI